MNRLLSHPYLRLMRVEKPIGLWLLLWPTYWGLWLAPSGWPSLHNWIIMTLGVFVMRSAGCVINDIADRKVDGHVQRTKSRPLATGEVSTQQALLLFTGLMLVAVALVLMTNPLTIQLAFFAAALAIVYPFMKRVTHGPQAVLGAAFSMGIPMAYAAETGSIHPAIWWAYATNLIWTVAYDTLYAVVDKPDDEHVGIKSTAILFGRHVPMAITLLQGLTLLGLALMGWSFELGYPYWLSLIIVLALMGYHQWLIRAKQAYFKAFLHNHWIGLVVLLGIVAARLS